MDRTKIEYNELINYVLPTSSIHTNEKEDKRQLFLNELNRLKADGQLDTPDINDEEINVAIFTHIYQYFYNQIIGTGNDHFITVFKKNGEQVMFSLLEALTLKEYLNGKERYKK